MRRILVTGGAGFIGSNYVQWMLDRYEDIHLTTYDALTYAGSKKNVSAFCERHEFVEADICSPIAVQAALRAGNIDTIVHFAAETHVDRSIAGPRAFIETNVVGTFNLLEAAREVWGARQDVRFHHISTDEVYGDLGPDDPPFTEDSPYRPSSPYSASKAASDHLVRAYHRTYGLPVTITCSSNNYGPRQHAEKFIPTVIGKCLAGEPIPIYGDGMQRRDWIYVDDHCAAIDATLRLGTVGETYCVGGVGWGESEVSNLSLVLDICNLMDERFPDRAPHAKLASYVADRPGHDRRYAVDSRRAVQSLGWRPREGLMTGLRKTVDWYVSRSKDAAPKAE